MTVFSEIGFISQWIIPLMMSIQHWFSLHFLSSIYQPTHKQDSINNNNPRQTYDWELIEMESSLMFSIISNIAPLMLWWRVMVVWWQGRVGGGGQAVDCVRHCCDGKLVASQSQCGNHHYTISYICSYYILNADMVIHNWVKVVNNNLCVL